MKTGIHFHCTDEAFPPLDFARMVEDEGIESIWLPDHSHVPVASRVPVEDKAQYGGVEGQLEKSFAKSHSPGGLPREYYRNHDQLIAIAMMGAVTKTVLFGTGICLVVQRDPAHPGQGGRYDRLSDWWTLPPRCRSRGTVERRGAREPRGEPQDPNRAHAGTYRRDEADLGPGTSRVSREAGRL